MENQLKVKTGSNPKSVASAISARIKEGAEQIEIITIGGGATNQAIKAVAIARGFLEPAKLDVTVVPSFTEVDVQGEKRTGLCLKVLKVELA